MYQRTVTNNTSPQNFTNKFCLTVTFAQLLLPSLLFIFFFFNDTATTEIYTLSLHDALPISIASTPSSSPTVTPTTFSASTTSVLSTSAKNPRSPCTATKKHFASFAAPSLMRSEEHTSELQSHSDLVCRLLLEKKKKKNMNTYMQPIVPRPHSTTPRTMDSRVSLNILRTPRTISYHLI